MGCPFEQHREAEVPATPEQVWEAIASGPGITSWFMGRNEVKDGVVRTVFGEFTPQYPVSISERPRRFAYGSEPADAAWPIVRPAGGGRCRLGDRCRERV
jgi:hypothetical protein